ncbi:MULTISPECIES: siderophore-interacting protein [unclassified Modicisalibacter]|uniref:siderophore-interacting protein n=1 Tax=unclassified Modicisalibacter TaxID=2679913 RepID=UPI001CCD5F05|nr:MULTISPECIES: siderophore-interacting protein [unclassified Modicisalibacter]MBZ9558445.1 siderophore-interacting protein [Modicisalibacter sp. R2A 31.J]MBZ9575663.1 siderophore-interacting protein [Modicisalibacter sp. MOD 31.J]
MKRSPPRSFTVLGKRYVTPNMLRITLGGDGLRTFPPDQAGGYVKLHCPAADGQTAVRTYTVSAQRDDALDIDFVVHDHGGPASRWALDAEPGDVIDVGGPGPRKRVAAGADWYLLVGDMTALPAIADNLAALPADARGQAVIEVMTADDIQSLVKPAGVDIAWVIEPHPGANSDRMLDAVRDLPWLPGRPAVWAACEFSGMRKLRAYFRNECGLQRGEFYISSYWKAGASEDGHRLEKRADAERDA